MLKLRVPGSGLMELLGALKTGGQGNPITMEARKCIVLLTTKVWACGMMNLNSILGLSFANMIWVSVHASKNFKKILDLTKIYKKI